MDRTQEIPINTGQYFDRQAAGWSARYRSGRHFARRLEIVLGRLDRLQAGGKEKHALDYGCGSGVLLTELLKRGYRVTGVDASPGMIAEARRAVNDLGPEMPCSLELVQGPAFDGRYLQQSYDTVICLGVLEYVDDDDSLLDRLVSILNPGGLLILSVPNRTSLLRRLEGFIHRNPTCFRKLGLFAHLTGPDAYLHHQKHQYARRALIDSLAGRGLVCESACFHVEPGFLAPLENYSAVGMTLIATFQKPA